MSRRPNGTPAHPARAFRVDPELWDAAKIEAARRGESLSAALVRFLSDYVAEGSQRR